MATNKVPKTFDLIYDYGDPSKNTQFPDAFLRSKGESSSIEARQKKVREALQRLNINIQKDGEPPIIALLGSGGGLRAMVGLLGVLSELAKENILDAITYICGTSGSTWCMSSLYNNENWSSCMEEMETQIANHLLNSSWNKEKALEKINQAFSKEVYSLTHFWAYVFIHMCMNEINEKTLSSHQTSCEDGKNPYPVYAAVEHDSLRTNKAGIWFEFTPHVAGFPAYKTFVKTELLGSQFRKGKLEKKHPEMDLCYLQGLWGSAPAVIQSIKDFISEQIGSLFPKFGFKASSNKRFVLLKESLDSEGKCTCTGCRKLEAILSSPDPVSDGQLEMLLRDFHDNTSYVGSFQGFSPESGLSVPSSPMDHGSAVFNPLLKNSVTLTMWSALGWCEESYLAFKIFLCFLLWQWGTTNNFLYEWSGDIPEDLRKKKFLSLIDAGHEINTAYPLMLPPNRKVDLILSFDFSAGDPFKTLKSTETYCYKNKIPFPKIDIEDKDFEVPSQSCYVFEGCKGVPVVMHFPLFNNQSCEGKVPELEKKYSTLNTSYDESEITELTDIAKLNVKQNKERILEKVKFIKPK
ncbi:cytosolic phospholipase A2 gamma-like [Leptodactylus fuscus]|uniref:cytosolic phospholipase A2 gamma-like n=1 Tax=Leptodactylus fuscus TaxID=238119 RepID=UPI003F4EA9B3